MWWSAAAAAVNRSSSHTSVNQFVHVTLYLCVHVRTFKLRTLKPRILLLEYLHILCDPRMRRYAFARQAHLVLELLHIKRNASTAIAVNT